MHLISRLSLACGPLFAVGFWFSPNARAEGEGAPDLEADYRQRILPIFVNYCYDCHGDGLRRGELALDDFETIDEMISDRDVWKRIRDHIDFRLMPPPDEWMPSDENRQALVDWIDAAVFPVDPENPDPGHVTMRRMNRTEYRNTIRDLLGVEVEVEGLLPPDDTGYGFDNIGDVLTISPAHLERYLDAARLAVDAAVHLGDMPRPREVVEGRRLQGDGERGDNGHFLHTNGEAYRELALPRPGLYRIEITAGGTLGGDDWPEMELRIDGEVAETFTVDRHMDRPGTFRHELNIDPRARTRVAAAFTNDAWLPEHEDPERRDRNLRVRRIVVEGPLDGPPPPKPETHRRIFGDERTVEDDSAYMLEVLQRFATRAFRRPPQEGEVERYLAFLEIARENDGGVEEAVRLAMQAMLVSPAFIFREEPVEKSGDGSGRSLVGEHALASRLSYFLWSTMPDERLLELADRGELRANLEAEVERMLKSERSEEFIRNFVGQWLQLRDLDAVQPDLVRFRSFDQTLAQAMREETERLFTHILRENLPAARLLDSDISFINERLATHYGIEGVEGEEFRPVSLEGTPRRGIFGHGSFLTLTSYPTRTSPVLRGKYVLENLLDQPTPPPPPNIPQLESPESHGEGLSLREQLERHRDDPNCASCHAIMDPIGFGLENFDAVGAWRDSDNQLPIDPAGKLVTGMEFASGEELREILANHHRRDFHRALATKMLTFALGRGTDWYDRPALEHVISTAEAESGSLRAFVHGVVSSVPFQYRRD